MSITTVKEFREKSCVAPFMHLSTSPSGACHLCCWHDTQPVLTTDGTPYNFNIIPIKEIWESEQYTEYRTEFRSNGVANQDTCNKICMSQGGNGNTKRNMLNNQFEDELILELINGKTPKFPKLVELKITSLCNLQCQTCGPENSTQFFKDAAYNPDYLKPMKKAFKIYLDTRADVFLSSILDNIDEVYYLEFYGGEPFMIKDHKLFLRKIIDAGKSKNIGLRYITNGTIYDDDYPDLFKEFKDVIISISMDSVFGKNEYMRMNSNWNEQIANILKFEEMLHLGALRNLNLNTTISLLNLIDYPEFIRVFDNILRPHPGVTLSISLLHDPSDLQIKHMHRKQKGMWEFLRDKLMQEPLKVFNKDEVLSIFDAINCGLYEK